MSLYELHDLSKYKIEKNVPIPQRDSNTSRMVQIISKMDDGDSIVLPIELLNVARNVTAASEHKFAIREIKNKHGAVERFRVWKNPFLTDQTDN